MYLCISKQRYAVMSIEIDKEILRSVLPSGLLDYFDVVDVEMRELSRIRLFRQKDR